ncbi:hypothetical protein CC80DRAFT_397298 [Byssothecium circinans]|uniref:Uncharacterized protein n=1 Tax=Byssothecium circinans TaxID=147558 RepID=A0A6A5UET5_9PLEO|nr:hypothetical protein CC80DRAFT_397298 [Byssothecium circinans]
MSSFKVTSVGSSSGAPSPPHATPRTDASGSIDEPVSTNLDAVGNILKPIEEVLNESAETAMLPSPPINTPETFSPAPSVYKGGRSRGLSGIGDRLMQLKLEERHDSASSSRSAAASIPEDDDEEVGGQDSARNEGKAPVRAPQLPQTATPSLLPHSQGNVPIALGSPKMNPRMEEFLNFTSDELPVVDPDKKGTSSTVVASAGDPVGGESSVSSSRLSMKSNASEDVVEKSNWAEEVMDYADRAIRQMEQLALDEFRVDPTRTFQEHFIARLNQVLQNENRVAKFEVHDNKKD